VNKWSRYFLQSVYVTSAKNAHLFEKTSLLLRISSLHIIVSVVNGESFLLSSLSDVSVSVVNGENFLLSSLDCLVKGSDPKCFKNKKQQKKNYYYKWHKKRKNK